MERKNWRGSGNFRMEKSPGELGDRQHLYGRPGSKQELRSRIQRVAIGPRRNSIAENEIGRERDAADRPDARCGEVKETQLKRTAQFK
jgi:hypothetical protein